MNGTIPNHVCVTPNGNRRAARAKGMKLDEAYVHGAHQALEIVERAFERGVRHVTFFGLSCENKANRAADEIDALQEGAIFFCDTAIDMGFKIHVFGKVDEFQGDPRYERLYSRLKRLRGIKIDPDDRVIHVAANYSGKATHELGELMRCVYELEYPVVQKNPEKYILSAGVPDVDLSIRTGGERRISGLLPFQMAYAELYFTDTLWTDFGRDEFDDALAWFSRQQRNYGK